MQKENNTAAQPVLNQNTFSWLWDFTKGKRAIYLLSVTLALLGVVCMLLSYICLAALIRELIAGGHEMDFYIQRGVQIGGSSGCCGTHFTDFRPIPRTVRPSG